MQRAKWTDRKFTFDFPEGWLANILERLRGTEIRIVYMIQAISEQDCEFKLNGGWSIKEHIGHLLDLEDLHEGRIEDFLERKAVLRAADVTNKRTYEANHNSRTKEELIGEFFMKRKQFVDQLQALDQETQRYKAMHPRLQIQMRPVDLAFFTAEHDDHHLADMRAILTLLKNSALN